MGAGMAFSVIVFVSAWLTTRRRPWTPLLLVLDRGRPVRDFGGHACSASPPTRCITRVMASAAGCSGARCSRPALLSSVLGANALVSGRSLPTFLEMFGPRGEARGSRCRCGVSARALVATVLVGGETALGFVFDPRYRDFPFASLTMAVVPFACLHAEPAASGPASDCGGSVCGTIGGLGDLHRRERGPRQLAVALDLRRLSVAGAYAVAGAGRAKPKINSPIASPDSTML